MELVKGDYLARVLLVKVDGALLRVDLNLCSEVISKNCTFASSLLVVDNHSRNILF